MLVRVVSLPKKTNIFNSIELNSKENATSLVWQSFQRKLNHKNTQFLAGYLFTKLIGYTIYSVS